jgi:hypothetical protein
LDAKCRYLKFSGLENQIPFAFLISLIMAARLAGEAAKMTIKGTVNSGISLSPEYNALALMTTYYCSCRLSNILKHHGSKQSRHSNATANAAVKATPVSIMLLLPPF